MTQNSASLEPVSETVVELNLPERAVAAMASVADAAARSIGGRLITISLWRPVTKDLVRVYSNMPGVYRPGGISSALGADWTRRCVDQLESFLAEDESIINSDAFEHQETLGALRLESAVNVVVAKTDIFLGCLNLLDSKGSYTSQSVSAAQHLAAPLRDVLQSIEGHGGA